MKPKIKDDLSARRPNMIMTIFYLTASLRDIGTHILGLVLALLHKHGVALLGVHLLPDHGLIC